MAQDIIGAGVIEKRVVCPSRRDYQNRKIVSINVQIVSQKVNRNLKALIIKTIRKGIKGRRETISVVPHEA